MSLPEQMRVLILWLLLHSIFNIGTLLIKLITNLKKVQNYKKYVIFKNKSCISGMINVKNFISSVFLKNILIFKRLTIYSFYSQITKNS